MHLPKLKANRKHVKHNSLFGGSNEKSLKSKQSRRVIRSDGSSKEENDSACVIAGFGREIDENCALLGYYAASSGNLLTTLQNNLSVPYKWSRFQTHG
jgi:hypothetical protein